VAGDSKIHEISLLIEETSVQDVQIARVIAPCRSSQMNANLYFARTVFKKASKAAELDLINQIEDHRSEALEIDQHSIKNQSMTV
jgi:hypothetical protein